MTWQMWLAIMIVIFMATMFTIQVIAEVKLQRKINRHKSMMAHPSYKSKEEI